LVGACLNILSFLLTASNSKNFHGIVLSMSNELYGGNDVNNIVHNLVSQYGMFSIHALIQTGFLSAHIEGQMIYYGINEYWYFCGMNNKQGGGGVGGSWRLVILFIFISTTYNNLVVDAKSRYKGSELLGTISLSLYYFTFSLSKAYHVDLDCSKTNDSRIDAILHICYPESKSEINGSVSADLMIIKGTLILFNELQGQIAEFWQVCTMLRIIGQGGWNVRRDRRLYDPLHKTKLNAFKVTDFHDWNVVSDWNLRKEIWLVYSCQFHYVPVLQEIIVEWLYYIPFSVGKSLPEIKSEYYFGISPNHSQLLLNNAHLSMESALKSHLNSQQLEASTESLNSNSSRRFSHYLMLFSFKLAIILLLLFTKITNEIMASNHPQKESTDPSPPEQGKINPDLLDCYLAGRWLSNKPICFHATRNRLADLWKPDHKMDAFLTENNRFLFQFYDQGEMERVLHTGPWHFDNYPMLLKKLQFGENLISMPIDTMDLWIQVHNLPFRFMTKSMGSLLGNHVGKLLKYDFNNYGTWRKYMRLKVSMNVTEPLKQCWEFEGDGVDPVNVVFKYENLGNFCYICGLLGHTDGFCPKRFEKGFV